MNNYTQQEATRTVQTHLDNSYYGMTVEQMKNFLQEKANNETGIFAEIINDFIQLVDWDELENDIDEDEDE